MFSKKVKQTLKSLATSDIPSSQRWIDMRSCLSIGLPPRLNPNTFQVGLDDVLSKITEELVQLSEMAELGRGIVRFAEGDYSEGKTLLCNCINEIAEELGFATVSIDLLPGGASLDRLDRIYPYVARSIKLLGATGIDHVILRAVENGNFDGGSEIDLRNLEGNEKLRLQIWIKRTKQSLEIDSRGFMMAALGLIESVAYANDKVDGLPISQGEREEICRSVLRGESVSVTEASKAGIRERFSKETSRTFLRSLSQFFSQTNLAKGTLFCFDEARRMPQNNRAIIDVCNNLQNLIDETATGRLPSTYYIFSFVSDFFEEIVPRYPALQQRITQHSRIKPADHVPQTVLLNGMADKTAALFFETNPSCKSTSWKKAKSFFVKTVPAEALSTGATRLMGATLIAYFDSLYEGLISDDFEDTQFMEFIRKQGKSLEHLEKEKAASGEKPSNSRFQEI